MSVLHGKMMLSVHLMTSTPNTSSTHSSLLAWGCPAHVASVARPSAAPGTMQACETTTLMYSRSTLSYLPAPTMPACAPAHPGVARRSRPGDRTVQAQVREAADNLSQVPLNG